MHVCRHGGLFCRGVGLLCREGGRVSGDGGLFRGGKEILRTDVDFFCGDNWLFCGDRNGVKELMHSFVIRRVRCVCSIVSVGGCSVELVAGKAGPSHVQ